MFHVYSYLIYDVVFICFYSSVFSSSSSSSSSWVPCFAFKASSLAFFKAALFSNKSFLFSSLALN